MYGCVSLTEADCLIIVASLVELIRALLVSNFTYSNEHKVLLSRSADPTQVLLQSNVSFNN